MYRSTASFLLLLLGILLLHPSSRKINPASSKGVSLLQNHAFLHKLIQILQELAPKLTGGGMASVESVTVKILQQDPLTAEMSEQTVT